MWLAAAIMGIIAIAAGISILPGGMPQKAPPTVSDTANPGTPANPSGPDASQPR